MVKLYLVTKHKDKFSHGIAYNQIVLFILETNVYGDIKMGFMVSKGQLEIDIIVVKGLKKTGLVQPPGKYLECYM